MACCATGASAADSNTNIIPTLTIDGQTFTNVELGTVTGARVAILYDGGGQRVAISNLPPNLQARLHYDPAAVAAQQAATDAAKTANKERIDKEKTTLSPAQPIRIVRMLPDHTIIIEPNKNIFIHGLPPAVSGYLATLARLQAEVDSAQATLDAAINGAGQVPGSGYRATPIGTVSTYAGVPQTYSQSRDQNVRGSAAVANANAREAAAGAAKNVADRQTQLANAKAHLALLNPATNPLRLIIARPSEYLLGGTVRWWEFDKMDTSSL
ncbi:MAG TPA: hypothetical protein VGR14_01335, partial [Verrucomicrobiae bacterium]|nr:hypothetical protein [Verrucomicrobiae bacterium]